MHYMTAEQAELWNSGDASRETMRGALVHIPSRVGATSNARDGEVVVDDGLPTCEARDFWSAIENDDGTDSDLYRDCMADMPANRVS